MALLVLQKFRVGPGEWEDMTVALRHLRMVLQNEMRQRRQRRQRRSYQHADSDAKRGRRTAKPSEPVDQKARDWKQVIDDEVNNWARGKNIHALLNDVVEENRENKHLANVPRLTG